jgi:hypothetical protein
MRRRRPLLGDQSEVSNVNISSNGNLQFTGANDNHFNNDCLPTINMNDLIAPYWDDLCDREAGGPA